MKPVTVKTAKYVDVRDKEQLYIIISTDTDKVIINVGKKTYEGINALIGEEGENTIKEQKIIEDETNNKTQKGGKK